MPDGPSNVSEYLVSMEQKLAEFRARRQAGNAAKKDQGAGPEHPEPDHEPTVAAHPDTSSTADRQQTENNRAAAQSSQTQVR